MSDTESEIVAGQPLKLLPKMEVHYDEVLAPGDLLYVPPSVSHFGVAVDELVVDFFSDL